MQPTRFTPHCFFQTFSGRCKVILVLTSPFASSLRWNFGLWLHVNLSGLCSNALSFKWQPPADFSVHLLESTAFLESSNIWISTCWDEKTIKTITKFEILTLKSEFALHFRSCKTWHNNEWSLSRLIECI